jgi:glutamyl-tRNA synthetase
MQIKFKKPRVRIAPSPTGPLHIGTTRTALFNYLFAKKYGGKFILRIEDTDLERSDPKYEKDIIDGLKWLKFKWDEFYKQSERIENYTKYLKKLLDSGQAFYCYHSEKELETEKKEKLEKKEAPIHICEHYDKTQASNLQSQKGIIRFRPPNKKIIFNDLIRGKVEFDSSLLGDFSIAKDLKTPLYNFAVVIDDYDTKISHVIRGEDHISNTPKQILLYEALALPIPQFAHVPLILGPDKSKLSKRHGATSLSEYKEQGYLPETLINFMALLGWSAQGRSASGGNHHEDEIFSLKELTKIFSLEKIQKSAAVFNIEKLDWFNGYYIRQMPIVKLTKACAPYLIKNGLIKPSFNNKLLLKILSLEQGRMKKLSEVGELTEFFFREPKYNPELLKWKNMTKKEIQETLNKLESILSEIKEKDFIAKNLEKILIIEAEKTGDRGKILWPLRVALTGRDKSPGPFEIAEILGKEKTIKRIRFAQAIL